MKTTIQGHTMTVAYVRVSTEDQVEYSPAAQTQRCRDFARLRDLGPVTVLSDEGWSGKNLDRPSIGKLLDLVRTDHVAHVVIWRWDRLSRDQGDSATLVKLFDRHGVKVHSVSEGELDLGSASGRMQVGVHGVFAQYFRDQLVENVRLGNRQAAQQGRWLNRAPTGYDMINKHLVPNEMAPVVRRIFALRAAGSSFPEIASDVGIGYSTVRHICENRAYVGEVRIRDEWFQGIHEALVTLEQFNAATRAHTQGQRRSRDLLSGIVRCGLCLRVAGVSYNERGQVLYRCKHRGQGCKQPGRSANGLHRAAALGLRVLAEDQDLQLAIREALTAQRRSGEPAGPSVASTIAGLNQKLRKLFDLYYANKISEDNFAVEEDRLNAQTAALRAEADSLKREEVQRELVADRFEEIAEMLSTLDLDAMWESATEGERRTLVEELVDSICIYPDQLTVTVAGAPPIVVTLAEVGLRAGISPVVSEGGLEPPRPCGHQPLKLARLPIPPLRRDR